MSQRGFPREELYGITTQLRRTFVSIPANIAEGCGREGEAELRRFLRIGLGSASELEYHLLLTRDLGFLPPHDYKRIIGKLIEVKRMLTVQAQKLKAED